MDRTLSAGLTAASAMAGGAHAVGLAEWLPAAPRACRAGPR